MSVKQEEKRQKSKAHILECAFAEFAEQGYLGASVNTICAAGKFSKGLLYHYYADKDALYLVCVQRCFPDLTAALRPGGGSPLKGLYCSVNLSHGKFLWDIFCARIWRAPPTPALP